MAHEQVPHLRIPFEIVGGMPATIEQDTPEEIEQSVRVLLKTERGERIEVPEYGVPEWAFEAGEDLGEVMAAIARWEPRAAAQIEASPNPDDELHRIVTVSLDRRTD